MNISRGKVPTAKKILVYGPEGIGKSTFASKFPDPVFIDTEGSTKELDVARFDPPTSFTMIKEQCRYIIQHPTEFKTLVIDTADWAEKLAIQSVLAEHNKSGIEDFGYGNGYRYVFERMGELLNILTDVVNAGVNVVVTAHAALRKFEQPDEMGSYDRYTMKLIDSQKTSVAAAFKEWADMVLFANYQTVLVTDSKTKKTKATGGKRVMYTTHHTCWDAKNRYGLPEEMPFDYEGIRAVIEGSGASAPAAPKAPEPKPTPTPAPKAEPEEVTQPKSAPEPEAEVENQAAADDGPDMRIPKALRDLMIKDGIDEWDVMNIVESKGFVPYGTKIWEYDTVNPGIVEGLLVAKWTTIRDMARTAKKAGEIPFN